jgi:hypothetical protein
LKVDGFFFLLLASFSIVKKEDEEEDKKRKERWEGRGGREGEGREGKAREVLLRKVSAEVLLVGLVQQSPAEAESPQAIV